MNWRKAVIAILAIALAQAVRAQEVAAVLGSDLRPYREAYEGFQEALGRAVPIVALEDAARLPRSVKVVACFGGQAASERYPDRVALVYGVAPGLEVEREGTTVKVSMEPEAETLLGAMRELQPGLKTLAVLWSSDAFRAFSKELEKAGAVASVAILSERIGSSDDLPAALRSLKGRAGAIWMPADPLLINPRSFEMIRQYSYDNETPFYAPTEGLVEHGAVAGVSVSYREIGRAAAEAAKGVLAGLPVAPLVHVKRVETSVNLTAAKSAAFPIPAAAVKKAVKVFP